MTPQCQVARWTATVRIDGSDTLRSTPLPSSGKLSIPLYAASRGCAFSCPEADRKIQSNCRKAAKPAAESAPTTADTKSGEDGQSVGLTSISEACSLSIRAIPSSGLSKSFSLAPIAASPSAVAIASLRVFSSMLLAAPSPILVIVIAPSASPVTAEWSNVRHGRSLVQRGTCSNCVTDGPPGTCSLFDESMSAVSFSDNISLCTAGFVAIVDSPTPASNRYVSNTIIHLTPSGNYKDTRFEPYSKSGGSKSGSRKSGRKSMGKDRSRGLHKVDRKIVELSNTDTPVFTRKPIGIQSDGEEDDDSDV